MQLSHIHISFNNAKLFSACNLFPKYVSIARPTVHYKMWNCLEIVEDLEILEPNQDGTENGTGSGIIGILIGIVETLTHSEK